MQKFIGVLSGTSMDEIDCGLCHFLPKFQLLETVSYPFPKGLKNLFLEAIETQHIGLETLGKLDVEMSDLFSDAILQLLEKTGLKSKDITAIGAHGQTLYHAPNGAKGFSIQISDPNRIVQHTHIPVVSDFRRADLAVGGQGAPLAPIFHQTLFQTPQANRAIINLGGISNLSFLPKGANNPILGYDIGPANTLLDTIAQQYLQKSFDKDSAFALTGQVDLPLLDACLSDPYFQRLPPKSTGREYFNLNWLNTKIARVKKQALAPKDIQATLLRVTVETLYEAILKLPMNTEIYLCGGGANNRTLLQQLSEKIQKPVETTEALGLNPNWVEAALFAWLAKQRIEQNSINLMGITGSAHPVILGGLYLPKTKA